jgi:Mannosyltransferase (PIG-V)
MRPNLASGSVVRGIRRPVSRVGATARELMRTAIPSDVLATFVSTRIGLTIVGIVAVAVLPAGHPTVLSPPTGILPIDVWTRWDGPFYVNIAAAGYDARPPLPNIVFFPLYPALIRVIAAIAGDGSLRFWVAALSVSLVSLVVAVAYLIALVRIDFSERVARRAAIFLLVFPTSLFLSATYPESLFLALSVASFYYARRERWWLVGLLGCAASLTRPYGALLAIPLAFEYLLQRDFDLRRVRLGFLWIGLIPLGLAFFLGYIAWKFQDPGVMGAAQEIWGRGFVPPWEVLAKYVEGPVIVHGFSYLGVSLVDLAFAAFFGVMVIYAWRRLRPTYAIYATLLLVTFLSSGKFVSVGRYGLALFPVFLGLALLADTRPSRDAIVSASLLFAGLAMAMFATVYWLA